MFDKGYHDGNLGLPKTEINNWYNFGYENGSHMRSLRSNVHPKIIDLERAVPGDSGPDSACVQAHLL